MKMTSDSISHIDRFVWVLLFSQNLFGTAGQFNFKSKGNICYLSSIYKTIPPFLSFSKYGFLLKNFLLLLISPYVRGLPNCRNFLLLPYWIYTFDVVD